MEKEELEIELKKLIPKMDITENEEGSMMKSIYLGSYMNLDPCGKYHHCLSTNEVTDECSKYWENLNEVAENLGGYINTGEGDPTDIYFEMPHDEEETDKDSD